MDVEPGLEATTAAQPEAARSLRAGRAVAGLIVLASAAGAWALGVDLVRRGQFDASTPWFVIFVFFLAAVIAGAIPATPRRANARHGPWLERADPLRSYGEGLVLLCSTGDVVLRSALVDRLALRGIRATVLDGHASELLPVANRILVPAGDAEEGQRVLSELIGG